MPIRDQIRLDLKAANQTADGQISSRAYPLTIWPRQDNQCDAFAVAGIDLSPPTSMIEMVWQNSADEIYTYPGNSLGFLGDIVEMGPGALTFYNLNTEAGVTVMITILSYRYNEPRYTLGVF